MVGCKKMDKCFLALYSDYEGDEDFLAFSTIEKAREAIDKGVEITVNNLVEQGFEIRKVRFNDNAISVYALGDNIYYNWEVITLDIK